MTKWVVICEKSSQAKSIKAAIGSKFGPVLPARGHILKLKEPDELRDDWKTWSAELLWPGEFYPKKPVADTMSLLTDMRKAFADADNVVIATDCDREGQLIGDEIVDFLKFNGKVYRAMFNAEDPKSLQDAFANLKPTSEYRGLYMAGQAREQADQISNLSLTRAASVTLKKPGSSGAIGIGRVKTPVLAIVAARELEIMNFKPADMFEVDAETHVDSGFMILSCSKMPDSLVKEEAAAVEEDDTEEEELAEGEEALAEEETTKGRILDKRIADGLKEAATGFKGPLNAKFEKKRQGPPKLFDLTAMQATCSSKFGWTGEQTLGVAQSLYAAPYHVLTYPRGEAQYIPENNIAHVPEMVRALMSISKFSVHRTLLQKPEIRRGKSGHFSDKALEGMSHYAIIPNYNSASTFAEVYPKLTDDQKKLFDLVTRQYLAALAPDFEYRQTTVEMVVPWKNHNWSFKNSGRVPLVLGWKEVLGGGGSDEDDFPQLKDKEMAEIRKATLRTVTTRPPARYTEGSLIKVMKEAWRLVPDPEKRKRLKEAKGIGTPATRGDVVKGLLVQGQIMNKGKQLMPTEGGLKLYQILHRICPNITDPGRTAEWEMLFDFVEKGRITAEDAVKRILASTKKEIENIRAATEQIAIGKTAKPSPKMIAAAKQISERKKIKLPPGVISDSAKCRAFLEEHLGQRPKNADGTDAPYPPSEKQLDFAKSLAEQTGLSIPDAALKSSKELSAWMEEAKKKAPARRPSEKQLSYAEKLSNEHGVPIPIEALQSVEVMSKWMDGLTKSSGGSSSGGSQGPRPPSDKQVALAKKIADEKKIKITDAILKDGKKCSEFISKHMGGSKK